MIYKYKITGSYGYAGTDFEDYEEFTEPQDPDKVADDYYREVMCQNLGCSAELVEEYEDDDNESD